MESKNHKTIKKLKLDPAIALDCEEFHVHLLNVESFKNKNMHFFYKEKRWFDIQNLILRATVAELS